MADWSRYAVGGANRPDSFTGLNPDFSSALSNMLAAAEQELGKNSLSITSAYRSPEKQAELYKAALKKYGSEKAARKWVAPPGKSMHNKGMAVDFGAAGGGLLRDANSPQAQWLKKNASRFGLAVPMSWEPWQVELAGARGKPNPNQAIASDTMRVLGKQPKGLLTAPQTTNDTESNMTPEQAPKGLLGSLGIQKMVEGAEGDAGQRFYNRQSFGDTMAALAPALGRMGVMGLDVPAQAVADRRFAKRDQEQKASKTIEALSRMNTPQAKQALEYLSAGGDPVAALKMAFGKAAPTKGVAVDNKLINPVTGEVIYQGEEKPAFEAKDVADARKEFTGRPEVKDFSKQTSAYGRVLASAKDPSAAGDLALIFNFMKVLDPGSTVREGEFATAQNAGGVDQRVVSLYNSITTGERLSPAQRDDFANRATRLYSDAESQYDNIARQYSTFAEQAGLPVDQVIPDFSYSGSRYESPLKFRRPPAPTGVSAEDWATSWENMSDEQRREFLGEGN